MMTRRPSMSTSVLPCDASMGRKYGYRPAALAILSCLNAGHLSKTSRMNESPPGGTSARGPAAEAEPCTDGNRGSQANPRQQNPKKDSRLGPKYVLSK